MSPSIPFFIHQVTKYKHLFFHSDLGLLLWDWPTIFHVLTVILWWLATVNSNTRIVVILFLSSQWDTTWHQATRIPLNVFLDLTNVMIGMALILPLISNSSILFFPKLSETVPSTQITVGIIVIFMFLNVCRSPVKSKYLSFRFLLFSLWWQSDDNFFLIFFIRLYHKILENFVSRFLGQILGCAYIIFSYCQISISCTITTV